jgi:hypothetical protein
VHCDRAGTRAIRWWSFVIELRRSSPEMTSVSKRYLT